MVIIDINSSDPNSDLWGPTKEFLEIEFLKDCKSVLSDAGKGYFFLIYFGIIKLINVKITKVCSLST